MDSKITSDTPTIEIKHAESSATKINGHCIQEQASAEIKARSNSRTTHFVFSYLFLVLLSTPLVYLIFGHDVYLQLVGENRILANIPDFKTTPLNDMPKQWDQYLQDKMPFRQVFMPGYIFTYEKILKTYVSEYVTGHGDDLFMNHAAPVLNAALGVIPYAEPWKEHVRLTAAGKHAYFMSKGIPFYLLVAPDKSTLYPELLPFYSNWIPHRTWYQEQISTLQKANIRLFPLNDILWQFKDRERMYDVMYDNCHWNGNALRHVYNSVARSMSMDNKAFSPVKDGEYYDLENMHVVMSVYGNEDTKFIRLKHTENFSCSELPQQYRSDGYNQICINSTVPDGSLWFFSDSYFGDTHGSNSVTPFVHNVHTYIHRAYSTGSKLFTDLADETLKYNKPDAVIEEFVERMIGTQHSITDTKLRIMGDYWMKTEGIFLEHKTALSAFSLQNIEHTAPGSDELLFNPDNRLSLKTPAAADDLGRVTVMGRLNAPSNTTVRIFYKTENGAEQTKDFGIAQGSQLFHETVYVKPFSKVNISLQFLTPGKYSLGKIQEIDDLRERM